MQRLALATALTADQRQRVRPGDTLLVAGGPGPDGGVVAGADQQLCARCRRRRAPRRRRRPASRRRAPRPAPSRRCRPPRPAPRSPESRRRPPGCAARIGRSWRRAASRLRLRDPEKRFALPSGRPRPPRSEPVRAADGLADAGARAGWMIAGARTGPPCGVAVEQAHRQLHHPHAVGDGVVAAQHHRAALAVALDPNRLPQRMIAV